MEVAPLGAARQKEAEADKLADDGGPGRPGHPQAEGEDQQGVQGDVQHRAAGDAHHGVGRAALVAQLVVQHQGGGHPGGPEEDDPEVGLRIGQDGGGGAQEHGQRLQKELAQNADHRPRRQGGEKAGGGHVAGLLKVLLPQLPGDEVAAAVAKEKAHRLDDGHEGEDHPHRPGGAVAFQHAHEEGVRHVVEGGDQHADDAGKGQPADQAADGGLGHLVEFLLLLFVQVVVHIGPRLSLFVRYPQPV